MARRSGARDLAGLAALAALGYNFFGPGRDRPKGAAKAPVEDRSRYVNRAGDAVTSDLAMGEPDYSAELAEYRRRVSPAQGVSPAASMPTPEADAATDARVMSAAERSGLDVSPGELAAMSGPAVRPAMAAPARVAPARAPVRAPVRAPARATPAPAGGSSGNLGTDSLQTLTNQLIDLNRLINDSTTTPTQKAQFEVARGRIQQAMRDRAMAGGRAKGGAVKAKPKKMASGGMTSASKRADGIATKGKTKCKMY